MKQLLRLFVFTSVAAALLAVHSVAAGTAGSKVMPSLHTVRRVEDDLMSSFVEGQEEAAYPSRRALYNGGYISYDGLKASKGACNGPCPAQGQRYTGPGCQSYFQCRS